MLGGQRRAYNVFASAANKAVPFPTILRRLGGGDRVPFLRNILPWQSS